MLDGAVGHPRTDLRPLCFTVETRGNMFHQQMLLFADLSIAGFMIPSKHGNEGRTLMYF